LALIKRFHRQFFTMILKSQKSLFSICAGITAFALLTVEIVPAGLAQTAPAVSAAPSVSGFSAADSASALSLRGLMFDPNQPLSMQFLLHSSDSTLNIVPDSTAQRVAEYFLGALAIPEDQLWVNLSPAEPDRTASEDLAKTRMGADLLEQDYQLKLLMARLMDPQTPTGQKFWETAKSLNTDKFSSHQLQSLQKVWVVPQKAVIYENDRGVFIAESRMGIMLEGEHRAVFGNKEEAEASDAVLSALREIVIPEVEREVNEGEAFRRLRQIYQAMILATWYKRKLKQSVLGQVYADQGKISGVENSGSVEMEQIYQDYLGAFDRGNGLIVEEYDPSSGTVVPVAYQTGGVEMAMLDGTLMISSLADMVLQSLTGGKVFLAGFEFQRIILFEVKFGEALIISAISSYLLIYYGVNFSIWLNRRKMQKKIEKEKAEKAEKAKETKSDKASLFKPGGVDFDSGLFQVFDVQTEGAGAQASVDKGLLAMKDQIRGFQPVLKNVQVVQDVKALILGSNIHIIDPVK